MIRQLEKPYTKKVKTISRWITIRFDRQDDVPYFIWRYRRISLDSVERSLYPMFYRDDEGKDCVISGYIPMVSTLCILVEIDPNGEYVRLWEEIEK